MTTFTANFSWPKPSGTDSPDGPGQVGALGDAADATMRIANNQDSFKHRVRHRREYQRHRHGRNVHADEHLSGGNGAARRVGADQQRTGRHVHGEAAGQTQLRNGEPRHMSTGSTVSFRIEERLL
jgi:hypothetical protein